MIAEARVVAVADAAGGTRLAALRSEAPLLLRPTPAGVYLVGGAAGPLGGDHLRLQLEVGPGATLAMRTAAAAVALPGLRGLPSCLEIDASVAGGGTLRWLPEPTVAAAGCDHRLLVRLAVEPAGAVVWREELVLGRHGERAGCFTGLLAVALGGRPLLRQELAVGDGGEGRDGWDGPAVTGGARAVGSVVVIDPSWVSRPPTGVAPVSDRAAVLALPGPAVQVAALADDAVALRRLLDAGLARLAAGTGVASPSDEVAFPPPSPRDHAGVGA